MLAISFVALEPSQVSVIVSVRYIFCVPKSCKIARKFTVSQSLAVHTKAVPSVTVFVFLWEQVLSLQRVLLMQLENVPLLAPRRCPVKSPPLIVTETVGKLMLNVLLSADNVYLADGVPCPPIELTPFVCVQYPSLNTLHEPPGPELRFVLIFFKT